MVILKIVFLFLAVFYGLNLVAKLHYKKTIEGLQFFLVTLGIVGFVVLQFNLL